MSFEIEMSKEELRERGYLRARDEAYDAIFGLWLTRSSKDNTTQKDIAAFLDRDTAWVSRALSGPANWTMRTLGELAEALDGVIHITVDPVESLKPSNFDKYVEIAEEIQNLTAIPVELNKLSGASGVTVTPTTRKRQNARVSGVFG